MTDIEHLERLAALRASGALSEDEFQAQKARLLAQADEVDVSDDEQKPSQIGRNIIIALALVLIGVVFLLRGITRSDEAKDAIAGNMTPVAESASPDGPTPVASRATTGIGSAAPTHGEIATSDSNVRASGDERQTPLVTSRSPSTISHPPIPAAAECEAHDWMAGSASDPNYWVITMRSQHANIASGGHTVLARIQQRLDLNSLMILLPTNAERGDANPFQLYCHTDGTAELTSNDGEHLQLSSVTRAD